jgi:hypothetical protein
MFTFRRTTKYEDETYGIKCVVLKENSMQCERKPAWVLNNRYFCNGHFQTEQQIARNTKEVFNNLDNPTENTQTEN